MGLATLLLFFPSLFAIFALCDTLQRRCAMRHKGWRYLTPGPMFWLDVFCGVLLTAVFTLLSLSNQGTLFMIAEHLPKDGPPPEPEAAQALQPAYAPSRT